MFHALHHVPPNVLILRVSSHWHILGMIVASEIMLVREMPTKKVT